MLFISHCIVNLSLLLGNVGECGVAAGGPWRQPAMSWFERQSEFPGLDVASLGVDQAFLNVSSQLDNLESSLWSRADDCYQVSQNASHLVYLNRAPISQSRTGLLV